MKLRIRKTKMDMKKAGVSLVTVLLFMLVATIAATATYKWLTSEGRSSGSRLQKQTAYQSSIAGIENARSWMTYHANDVGALIKAYIDGGNKPVNIDSRLRTLQRPGQNYHVWLTGVNTENSTYKLKILSSGEAPGGAKHSEIAIFNVDGLYRVNVPVEHHQATTDFEYAYFGGGVSGTRTYYESAVINGNWGANPPNTSKNWIVTGNASLSGSMITVGQTSCIGGNLNANNGITSNDLFVGGDVTGTALQVNIARDAYIVGNMVMGDQPIEIGRHLTMLGKIKTKPSANYFSVGGNLCAGENATLVHEHKKGTDGTNYNQTKVAGNVWMPGAYNIWFKNISCTRATKKNCKCDNKGTEINCDEFGKVNINDQTQYKVTSCTEHVTMTAVNFNDQNKENGPRYHCTDFNLSAPLPPDNYDFGDGDYEADNYESYNYLWNGKNKGGFLLGEGSDTKAYVKSGRSWTDLDSKATTKYKEKTDHPRQCKSGYPVYMRSDIKTCGNSSNASDDHYKNWSNEEYSPYYSYDSAKSNKPSSLHYIYYMPDGVKDVDFGVYADSYWKWCTQSFGGYCQKWNASTDLYGYFVNAPSNDKAHVFTNSGHSNDDGNHDVMVGSNYYRYLNNTGGEITGSPWCKIAKGKEWRPVCGVGPWFATNGQMIHNLPADGVPFECAESAKETCDAIWLNEPGCDESSYKVPDALVTAKTSFEPYASKGCGATITEWNNSLVDKLNKCYSDHVNNDTYKNENFYNGYVVVKLTSKDQNASPTGTLKGKFIIIADVEINAQNGIFTANDTSFVFMYLNHGAKYLQGTANNLFIYSVGPFSETSKIHLTGTIYTPVDECIRIHFEDAELNYSPKLITALTKANIICNNDGSPCGGTATSSSSIVTSSTSVDANGGLDTYYISMAPQLGVTIESQYENNEPDPSTGSQTALAPSFIILPRIIYLPDDPFGYLHDYYNVLPLNGSTISKDDLTSVSCTPSLNTASKLYDGTALEHGIYKCTAKANEHPDVAFWVQVGNSKRGDPTVSFIETSQEMATTDAKEVHVRISPHSEPITITTSCPGKPDGWDYTPNSGTIADNKCTFEIPANTELEERKLFDVSTDNAPNGTLSFALYAGEGYLIGNAYAGLHVSSTATLQREEATSAEIQSYCSDHPGVCPANIQDWPKMDCGGSSVVWVRPTGNYGNISINNTWSIPVGGTGTVTLESVSANGCVAIIPTTDNSYELSALEADHTPPYTLRASVFAQKKTLRVGFVGDPGEGNDPQIVASVGTRGDRTCSYNNASGSPRYCEIDVFLGEAVTLTVLNNSESENFSYWQCASDNCPDREPLANKYYGSFVISGNYDYLAHFGESDKHCFFDEFKDGSVPGRTNRANIECLDGSTEYCIDYCDGTCPTASTEQNVKWRLLRGSISNISYSQYYGHISAKGSVNKGKKDASREGIVVMSTVKAGLEGTMKALIQLPRASAHGSESRAIRNSGFILRSNAEATQYLMLNAYVNSSGNLEAQLCKYNEGEYSGCESKQLLNGSSAASVDVSSMVMISAELNDNVLSVSAFTGNYYGSSPTQYSNSFDISGPEFGDRAHEYVGFSLADQNFKIYGIGWRSEDYDSECHDTYPVVKCSFAAVAKGGIVETGKNVKPWVGHSGWFDRASWSCTEEFYYYNGSDAGCGNAGNSGLTCNPYHFDNDQAGAHGYRSNDMDIKTAKAWLNCSSSDPEAMPWMATSEEERAHCGYFWTGEYSECANNADLVSDEYTISGGTNQSIPFAGTANLRKATLNISLENNDANELEIWLYSENDGDGCWGNCDPFESQSVKVSSATLATFDVSSVFIGDSSGFNPEKVKGMVIANHGNSYVTLKSVSSACENALSITGCSASFSGQLWTISATVNGKTEKIEEITYTAEARDNATSTSGTQQFNQTNDCQNGECLGETTDGTPPVTTFTFTKEDTPYKTNQGKYYAFSINVVGNGGRSNHTYSSCSVTPSPIGSLSASCELAGADEGPAMQQGKGLPQFKASFSGECPTGGCSYQMTLDGTEFASGQSKNPVGHTPPGNTETAAPYAYTVGTEHTYRLVSTDADHPFTPDESCEQTFKITEKELNPVGVNCENISIADPHVSSSRKIDATQVTVTNCETGCTYTIKEGDVEKGSGTYGENQDYEFTSAGTAGAHTYTLIIQRTNDSKKASCTFSETYPLDVTCGISAVGSEENPHDPAVAVSVSPTTVKGCGSACTYSIDGGNSPTPTSGSSYDGGDVSFKDAAAKGKQSYTLTIAHNGVDDVTCGFDVTYVSGGSGGSVLQATCPAVSTYPLKTTDWGITTTGYGNLTSDVTRDVYIGSDKVVSTGCGQYHCPDMESYAPTQDVGTYTYYLKVGSDELCNGTYEIKNPLVCSSQPAGINIGNSFTAKASWATDVDGNPSDCSLSGDGVPSGGDCYNDPSKFNTNLSISPVAVGSFDYIYSVKLSNNNELAGPFTCKWSVTVAMTACNPPTGCSSPVTSGTFASDGRCYYATSVNYINFEKSYTVNGTSLSGYKAAGDMPAKRDGGYYIKTQSGSDYGSSVTLGARLCN